MYFLVCDVSADTGMLKKVKTIKHPSTGALFYYGTDTFNSRIEVLLYKLYLHVFVASGYISVSMVMQNTPRVTFAHTQICKRKHGLHNTERITSTYYIIQICSGITSGRVFDGELLYTKILEYLENG